MLCVALTAPHAARAEAPAGDQQGQQSSARSPGSGATPAPTPYVRPRTVGPRAEQPPATNAPAGVDAASGVAHEVGEDEVVRVDSNLVIVPATVVDGRGRAVTDLRLDDFELRIDGQVKPISELSRAETPVHIAMLFDNSASLSAAREFERQAATRFFGSVVRPIDRAAIYAISTDPVLSQPFTNDVQRLVRTIERFGKPEGATALFDAVKQAANYLRPIPGRKIVVVVSDGTDTVSETNFEQALQHVLHADCQVYVVMTRQLEDPNFRDTVSEQFMARLSEQTGGAIYIPRAVDELDSVFSQISRDLAEQYVLSYYPQEERQDKYFRFIGLRVKTRPHLRVRARRGFYPGAAQNQALLPPPTVTTAGGSDTNSMRAASEGAAGLSSPGYAEAPGRERTGGAGNPAESITINRDAAYTRRVGPAGPGEEEDNRTPAMNGPVESVASSRSDRTERAPVADAPAQRRPTSTAAAATQVDTPAPAPTQVAKAAPARDAGQAAAPTKPPASGGVLNGKALRLPMPAYPPAAKSAGASGKVEVEVTIDVRGKVVAARAISGHPMLQSTAVDAARQARFSPTILSGQPVEVTGTIFYSFALR